VDGNGKKERALSACIPLLAFVAIYWRAGCTETCKSRFGEGQLETYLKRQRAGCLLSTQTLIPRGLVGRLSTVLGCRALVLLHDEHGHPLLATTHRGDQHLTVGLPSIMTRYEGQAGGLSIGRVIVDREGMAAEFLATLCAAGRTVISVLRADQ
jgi:hypothetical protein